MTDNESSPPGRGENSAGSVARRTADDRREALIEATAHCLATRGAEQTSVRSISRRAGVSLGLVNHYYGSKEELIADTYRRVADNLLATLKREVARRGGATARERLSAFFKASFSPVALDPDLLRVWLSFWGMVYQSARIAEIHARTYGEYRAELERMLIELAQEEAIPDLDVRLAAIGLSGLLDGLWLEWCLSARTFSPEEAVRLCEGSLDGMLAGVRGGSARAEPPPAD